MKPQLIQPSPRHDHLYAIIRYEADAPADTPIEFRVTIKKLVRSARQADEEIHRLNALNGGKGSYYFAQVTRLEHDVVAVEAVERERLP